MDSKIIIGLVVVFSVLAIFGSYFILVSGQKPTPKITTYSSEDKMKPKVVAKSVFADLGSMKVSEDKSVDFVISNSGQKTLQLSGITSSCNCTFAQVIIDGKESDLYGMHAPSNFAGEVLPGKNAKIRVIYRPSVMPVYGDVGREVYVETNDPDNPRLVFKIKANVK